MARFTKDYHPVRVVPDAAAAAGHPGLVMHPFWISGLLDLGLTMLGKSDPVVRMKIDHTKQVYQGDVLTLELETGDRSKDRMEFAFQVVNQKRGRVARGKVTCVVGWTW